MSDTPITTEGITREDVDAAMAYLGMHNPKPDIPIHETISGHEIVAIARKLTYLENKLARLFDLAEHGSNGVVAVKDLIGAVLFEDTKLLYHQVDQRQKMLDAIGYTPKDEGS